MNKNGVNKFYYFFYSLLKEVYVVLFEKLCFRTVVFVVTVDDMVDELHLKRNIGKNNH